MSEYYKEENKYLKACLYGLLIRYHPNGAELGRVWIDSQDWNSYIMKVTENHTRESFIMSVSRKNPEYV